METNNEHDEHLEMKQQHEEPEESMQDNFESPLGAPVIEKHYTRSNVKVEPGQLDTQIPEPSIHAETIDLTRPAPKAEPPKDEAPPKPHQDFNPQMSQLRPKDKRDAAERAVDAVLDGYAWLKSSSNYFLKINEGQVKKLTALGKLDVKLPLPFDASGRTITIAEYIAEFNRQNEDALEFSAEDREQIRPVMIKYFEEAGVGMSVRDELIYLGVKELITWGAQMWQGLAIKKEMVKALIEHTESLKGNVPPPVYNTAPPPPPPPHGEDNTYDPPPYVEQNNPEDTGVISEATVISDADIPLAMRGANSAALSMTGAIHDDQHAAPPKKRSGRLSKEDAEKRKQERMKRTNE